VTGLRTLCGLAFFAVVLAACSRNEIPSGRSAPGEVRFSIPSGGESGRVAADWQPILTDMQARSALKVTPIFSADEELLVEAMQQKKTELGWFSNSSALEAVRHAGGEVFARAVDARGHDAHASVLIVGVKSRISLDQVLKCDHRLSLALGDAASTSGNLAPLTYLFAPRGLDPSACLRQVRTGGSDEAILDSVARGQVDVGANDTFALLLAARQGRKAAAEVRVIWRSPALPQDPLLWRRDLDPAVKEKLRQFFLTYGQGDTPLTLRQRALLAKIDLGGFAPADNSHLLPAREMEATEQWLLARKGRDPARIEAKRRALEAIRAERMALEARTRAPAAAQ
jgi:phosphonate transport system substrate-binding protein